jgi:DNA-binding transcriptional MocR family regulator
MRLPSPWTPRLSAQFASPAERLVAALADDILQGELDAGARLPAHRALADKLGIGVGTVTKAYAVLERRGLVRTVKGCATFVAATQPGRGQLIDLARNVPPATITQGLLARTLAAVAKRFDAGVFNDYPPLGGHAEHRRLLARWFASLGMECDPDLLLLTNGAHQALSLAFSIACPNGGTVLTEMQTYPGALALANYHGLHVAGIAMDAEGMLPEALERALTSLRGTRAALYVTPTMHNPSTATMGRVRREAIVAICREHDIPIIEDDVYNLGVERDLLPLAMLAPERTLYANSMSKSLNPTLRIGALVVPPSAMGAAETLYQAMSIVVSPLSCAVMAQWLLDGTAEAVNQAIRHASAQRMQLAASLLGERLRVPSYPGYHVWMPMGREDAADLYKAAAAAGIVLTPPCATSAGAPARQGGIRLCLGGASLPDLALALGTIARMRCALADRPDPQALAF